MEYFKCAIIIWGSCAGSRVIAHSPNFTDILTLPNNKNCSGLAKLKYKTNTSHPTLWISMFKC